MSENLNHQYSKKEETLNVLTHGIGLLLSLITFPFLISKSFDYNDGWKQASFVIYGASLFVLYAASTFYHSSKNPKARRKLNILDHAAIYILIAGSYTPFCLVGLDSTTGWYMFVFVWLFAFIGVFLKLFFTGRFDKISTGIYLLMGWQIMFIIKPLTESLSASTLFWIVTGGVFYTLGAIFYSIARIKYNHAIFHVFVLLGSGSHFIAIFFNL